MVVLVPRQLRMSGMTGNVPYYGGRFSPAQAYAAFHEQIEALVASGADLILIETNPGPA